MTKKVWAIAAAFFAGTFLVYARSLGYSFIDFDDWGVLLRQTQLFGQPSFADSLRAIFVSELPREEPLLVRDVSWAIDGQLYGFGNPLGYHLGNVLLNAACASLLFLFLWLSTKKLHFAVIVSALWAIVPLHVEPVAWVMGRKDLLCAFFMLLALVFEASEKKFGWVGSLVCAPLALFSKASGVALLPLLVLFRFFRGEPPMKIAIRLLPHAVVLAVGTVWYGKVVAEFGVLDRGPGMTLEYLGILARYLPLVFSKYFELLALPFDMSISFEWPMIGVDLTSVELARAVLFYPLAIAATIWFWKKRRDLLFYWLAFFALMIPYLNLRYIGIWIAVRYLYLSSFCLIAIAVALLAEKKLGKVVLGAIGLVYLLQTQLHLGAFSSNLALWEYEVSRDKPSVFSYARVVAEYLKRAEQEQDPAAKQSWLALAAEHVDLGLKRFDELELKKTAYPVDATSSAANLHYDRGEIGRLRGDPPESWMPHWQKAIELAPTYPLYPLALSEHERDLAQRSAGEQRLEHARRALQYFGRFFNLTWGDPLAKRENLAALSDDWVKTFPELCPEIKTLMEKMERGSSAAVTCP